LWLSLQIASKLMDDILEQNCTQAIQPRQVGANGSAGNRPWRLNPDGRWPDERWHVNNLL
jgi:hypothetical protein